MSASNADPLTLRRVHLGTDHAGFELKEHLKKVLAKEGYEPVDHGNLVYDKDDDYPSFCITAAEAVRADPGQLGVVIGGSGNGEQMAANLVNGIRCGLAWSVETAQLTREHNDAQVVAVGARMHSLEEATEIVLAFLRTTFSGDPRHERRIAEMTAYGHRR